MRIFVRFLMAFGLLFSSAAFSMTEETVISVSRAEAAGNLVRNFKKSFKEFSEKIKTNGNIDKNDLCEDLGYYRDRVACLRAHLYEGQSSQCSGVVESVDFVLDQMDQKLGDIEQEVEKLGDLDSVSDRLNIARIDVSRLEIERTFGRLFAIFSGRVTSISQKRSAANVVFSKLKEEPLKVLMASFTSFFDRRKFSESNGRFSSNGGIGRVANTMQADSGTFQTICGSLLKQCGTVDDNLNDLECRLHPKEGDDRLQKNTFAQLLNELGDCCLNIGLVSRCVQKTKLNANDLKTFLTLIKYNRYVPAGTLGIKGAETLLRYRWGFKILLKFIGEESCEKLKKAVDERKPSSGFISEATKIVDTYRLRPLFDTFQAIIDQHPQYADSIVIIFKYLVEHEGDLKKIGNSLKKVAHYFEQFPEGNVDAGIKGYFSTIARGWEYDSDKEWDSDLDDESDYSDCLDSEESDCSYYSDSEDCFVVPAASQKEQDHVGASSGELHSPGHDDISESDNDSVVDIEQAAPETEAGNSDVSELDGDSDESENNNDEEELQEPGGTIEPLAQDASELDGDSGSGGQKNLDSSSTQKSTGLFTRVKGYCSRIFNSFGPVLRSAGNQVTRRLSSIFGSVSDAVSKGISALVSPFKSLKFW